MGSVQSRKKKIKKERKNYMAKEKFKMHLPGIDDLFSTEEQRQEEKLTKIYDIPISEIDDFPDHPFRIREDEDMNDLMESVRERGVITPAMVRRKEDGRYEMISGHRRKRACELLGLETLRCEIVDLTKDESTVVMVESNFQRSKILPSEKAFAYKMRLDAMKRLPGRKPSENGGPVGPDLKSTEKLAEEIDDSPTQIKRYIRLTYLVPELLAFVDEGRMKMRPAVELSYLNEEAQRDVVDCIDKYDAIPSHDQAIRIRKAFEAGTLNYDAVNAVMRELKPNQKTKFALSYEKIAHLLPENSTKQQLEDYILEALKQYNKYLQKKKDKGAR